MGGDGLEGGEGGEGGRGWSCWMGGYGIAHGLVVNVDFVGGRFLTV